MRGAHPADAVRAGLHGRRGGAQEGRDARARAADRGVGAEPAALFGNNEKTNGDYRGEVGIDVPNLKIC